ncbi:hypothetical protein [Sanguibacter sp. HDW7]|uniref:hypothetical protein n=1 Tax=Sanguibacter sp. HDW7 TaxID=2714931 RepID=UPI00140C1D10|nr:hypothetical protein [Sanguibacter sp. HDW7]QIK84519.1 hypothetical protein G7063_13535 [Sanguibacter sp. HDW7]
MHESDGWRLATLVREAVRNALGARGRLVPLVLAAVLAGAAHVAVAVNASARLDASLTDLESEGRHVVTISTKDVPGQSRGAGTTGVRPASCEALTRVPGVELAGVVVEDVEKLATAQLGSFVPVRRVSSSLVPEVATHDVVVGTSLAERVGLDATPGARVSLGGLGAEAQDAVVGGGRVLPSTIAIFTARAPGDAPAAECRVAMSRFVDVERMLPILTGSLRTVGAETVVEPMLRETTDVVALHAGRVDRLLPVLLGVLGGLVTAVLALLRSAELATYRLAGTSRRSLGLLLGFEASLLGGVFLASSALAILALRGELVAPLASGAWALAGACAWVAVASLLTAPLLRRRPSDMAKDR